VSDFQPAGDQPAAIAALSKAIDEGERFQTLLGITGSGKSATIAWTIEQTQRPTLILAPNKSLAAQLAQEMREFFPDNRVEYFVSYYDYYQPEAYIPSSDTYIEKDSSINDEIDRLRHSATAALLTRRDVIVVASVSCIYGMGNPEEYRGNLLDLSVGVDYDMRNILRRLVDMQYGRNDMTLGRGNFRVRGDTIEVHPAYEESVLRIEMFGDTVDRITTIDPLTGEQLSELQRAHVFPATHYVTGPERLRSAMVGHRGGTPGTAPVVRGERQAPRSPASADAHAVRPRDDERGRLLQRHRELLDAHGRPRARASRRSPCSTTSPTTTCS
jgi:excinuclease ABC subunit B